MPFLIGGMNMNDMEFIEALKTKRNACGYSQSRLAKELHISRQNLNEIENGKTRASKEMKHTLLHYLDYCKCTQPFTLNIDYLRVRFPTTDALEIIKNVLAMKAEYFIHEDYGLFGYEELYRYGDIIVTASKDASMGVLLEVAHDKKHPFIVESDDFKLQVLGTKFNISNYKGGATNIVLVEGAVEVTDKNEKKARLNPNDLLNIANGTIAYQKQVDVAEYISWVEGIMLLNGNDLSQIIQRLSIYYGIPIQCDPIIGKEKVYGKLDLKDDIDEVIECIQQTLPFTIEKSDTSIYLNK